jgi:hypothetical protein
MVTSCRDTITASNYTPTISRNKAAAAENTDTNAANQAEDAKGMDKKTKNSPCRGEQDFSFKGTGLSFLRAYTS